MTDEINTDEVDLDVQYAREIILSIIALNERVLAMNETLLEMLLAPEISFDAAAIDLKDLPQ